MDIGSTRRGFKLIMIYSWNRQEYGIKKWKGRTFQTKLENYIKHVRLFFELNKVSEIKNFNGYI